MIYKIMILIIIFFIGIGSVYAEIPPRTADAVLMWQERAHEKREDWDNASAYCRELVIEGYKDWRLPVRHELEERYRTGHESSKSIYWSATEDSASDNAEAWAVGFGDGMGYWYCKTVKLDVRCVREKP